MSSVALKAAATDPAGLGAGLLGGLGAGLLKLLPLPLLLLLMTAGLVVYVPGWITGAAFALLFLGLGFCPVERALRFDYNLFLRQRLGWLSAGVTSTPPGPLSQARVLAFARWLGAESILTAHRRLSTGYRFQLHPVAIAGFEWLGPWFRPGASTLTLLTDGTVEARFGPRDAADLERLRLAPPGLPSAPVSAADSAEAEVVASVRCALAAFVDGRTRADVLGFLGHRPATGIFAVDPSRTGNVFAQRLAGALGVLLALWMIVSSIHSPAEERRRRVPYRRSVAISLEQARADIGALGSHTPPGSRRRWETVQDALHRGLQLPPADWLPPAAREYLATNLVGAHIGARPTLDERLEAVLGSPAFLKAFHFGWFGTNDLAALGITPATLRQALTAWDPPRRARALDPQVISVVGRAYSVLETDGLRWRVAFLRTLDGLDLLDRPQLVAQLRDHQVLRGRPPVPGRRPDLDRTLWNGLFATRGDSLLAEGEFRTTLTVSTVAADGSRDPRRANWDEIEAALMEAGVAGRTDSMFHL
jgi:hypothetical protein